MAEIREYKCPACGGAMEFDTETQNMKCPYCDTVIPIEEFQTMQENDKEEQAVSGAEWKAAGSGEWQEGEADRLNIYICNSCGGEIISEEQTGALSCPYCGNSIVLKEHFSGDLKPDYVIPFQLDKKAAKEAYYRHLQGKAFLPRIFKDDNHINEIKGVYVPFWLFDTSAFASIDYSATRLRVWRVGDIEYTEHKSYQLKREGSIDFKSVPADASKSMDDALMESIEPFDFSKAVPFKPEYLAGFVADRYDVQKEDRLDRVRDRVSQSIENSFERTLPAYELVEKKRCDISFKEGTYAYALYPVWLLSTSWQGKNYLFAMNGQTGKMVGDLPADNKAFWRYVAIRTVIAAFIIHLISYFFLML